MYSDRKLGSFIRSEARGPWSDDWTCRDRHNVSTVLPSFDMYTLLIFPLFILTGSDVTLCHSKISLVVP